MLSIVNWLRKIARDITKLTPGEVDSLKKRLSDVMFLFSEVGYDLSSLKPMVAKMKPETVKNVYSEVKTYCTGKDEIFSVLLKEPFTKDVFSQFSQRYSELMDILNEAVRSEQTRSDRNRKLRNLLLSKGSKEIKYSETK